MSDRITPRRDSDHTPIRRQLVFALCICVGVLAIALFAGLALIDSLDTTDALRAEIVGLNELSQNTTPEGAQAIAQAQEALRHASDMDKNSMVAALVLLFLVSVSCLSGLALYLYLSIVRPFARLQDFAEQVASGNLDLPLEYERSNPFGKFAWAFDHMRVELKRARAAERAAIEENKNVIASLAHDLRTPVASIRTYSEALSMGLESSEQERREYAEVIERRSVEVSQLVDDMLTHSLAELDRIRVECSAVPIQPLIHQVVAEFGLLENAEVDAQEAIVTADELRLRQAIENLLVNASKYAPNGDMRISGSVADRGWYRIEVRDFGPGMDDADIPFAFDRFYRGSNSRDVSGSGLGLYVVRYVVDRMGGKVSIANAHPGLSVCMDIPIEKNQAS